MIEYKLSESIEFAHDNGFIHSYGIALYSGGRRVRTIEDISPDKESVEELIRVFNEEGLDPVHFGQAVEDFLYG